MLLNKSTKVAIDMPKLQSPFERENTTAGYVCVSRIRDDFDWVFTNEAVAVEKIDGTNVSIVIEDGKVKEIWNRKNKIEMWKKGNKHFLEGILNAIEKGYIKPSKMSDGQYFGELIGPKLNNNPYSLDEHLWIPFSYLVDRYRFRFWDKFVADELKERNEKEIYNRVSALFKGLWSLMKRKIASKIGACHFLPEYVDETVSFEGMAAEGMVFYKKSFLKAIDAGSDLLEIQQGTRNLVCICKLRRDMFDWFKQL